MSNYSSNRKWHENYVSQITKIFNFYYSHHKSIDTLPIILLHGPSGSGKIRIAQSVCSVLSLNLSKVII